MFLYPKYICDIILYLIFFVYQLLFYELIHFQAFASLPDTGDFQVLVPSFTFLLGWRVPLQSVHYTSSKLPLDISISVHGVFLTPVCQLMTAELSPTVSKTFLSNFCSVSNIHHIYHLCPLLATARDSLPFAWMSSNPFSAILPNESPKSTSLYSFQSTVIVLRVNLMSY